jgi:hypothetical protein
MPARSLPVISHVISSQMLESLTLDTFWLSLLILFSFRRESVRVVARFGHAFAVEQISNLIRFEGLVFQVTLANQIGVVLTLPPSSKMQHTFCIHPYSPQH